MSDRANTIAFIERLYADAKGRWWGCNWLSEFGPQHLSLCDMRAYQANLMAEATSGEEAAAWKQATSFLKRIEADAHDAERHATKAVSFVRACDFAKAMTEINAAAALETRHRKCVVWKRLQDEITALACPIPSRI